VCGRRKNCTQLNGTVFVNDELQRMWKEAGAARFCIIPASHMSSLTEQNRDKTELDCLAIPEHSYAARIES
jgi:hypothetical protein